MFFLNVQPYEDISNKLLDMLSSNVVRNEAVWQTVAVNTSSWVTVKELKLSYYNPETRLCTTDPYYGISI